VFEYFVLLFLSKHCANFAELAITAR
jgi:hypothetical protein